MEVWAVDDASPLGEYAERLRQIEYAEEQRRAARAAEARRKLAFEAAVAKYVGDRVPGDVREGAERDSLTATQEHVASLLLRGPPALVTDIWGAHGFTLEEFRAERGDILGRWARAWCIEQLLEMCDRERR